MIKIIAEVGCNYNTLEEAFQFIEESAKLNLFACKFQIFNFDLIRDHPQREFLESIMIDKKRAIMLLHYGKDVGIPVFFSVMYRAAFSWLRELDPLYYKIRYADRFDEDILWYSLHSGKPVFISYGYNEQMIELPNIIKLFCSPIYPSKLTDYRFSIRYGYEPRYDGLSNHVGLELLKLHVDYGKYEYHEVHCKLDNTEPLEDAWSVSFSELRKVLNK